MAGVSVRYLILQNLGSVKALCMLCFTDHNLRRKRGILSRNRHRSNCQALSRQCFCPLPRPYTCGKHERQTRTVHDDKSD